MTTGLWDVIIPEAGTNLVYNPAAVITGNLTAIGAGTVSRVTTYSYYGPGCHRIQASADNTGGYFTMKAATNAIHYVTLRIHTASDVATFDVSMDNSNWNAMTLLSTEGSWWVYGVQIPAAQANASTALRIQQNGAGAIDMYIGFVQVEANTYATTPIWGDLSGFIGGYSWEGTANGSASKRTSQERSGGKVVDIYDTYGVSVLWADGIGMPPVTHHSQSQALLPGRTYTGHKIEPRVMDLTMLMSAGHDPATIHSARKDIIDVLKLDAVKGSQPVILRYRGALSTKPVEFYAVYDTGLNFAMNGQANDQPTVRMICYDPFAYEVGEASAQLTTTQDIANANYAVKRIDGTWSNISTTFDGLVMCFAKAHDGCIYIGGTWTADVSTAADGYGIGIIKYNPTTGALTSLGTGLGGNKDVYDMAVAPNGDLYITGDFTDAGGTAAADYCAYWDISAGAWAAIGSGLGGVGWAIAIGQDGKVYFGGEFTNLTDANGDYITYWSGSAFVSMGTGMNNIVYDLHVSDNGNLYAGGQFTLAGGVANTARIAYWNGTAWNAMDAGADDSIVFAITSDHSNNVYIGGTFSAASGDSGTYIAKWNGQAWLDIGSANSRVMYLKWTDGLLHSGGLFTTIGDITTSNKYAIWNGYTWTHAPLGFPGSDPVSCVLINGTSLYIGYQDAGTVTSSYLNTVTNSGTARAYPVVHISRSGGTSAGVRWLKNETTGATIYMDYDLLDGEELILDFRLGQRSVTSSFFGDVQSRAVLRGSDFSEFFLQSGSNSISAYVYQVGSPTMTAYMTWRTTHLSADGAAA